MSGRTMGQWLAREASISAAVLTDEISLYAREMAGEADAAETTDRENILAAAALEIESFVGRVLWTGPGGAQRTAISEIEVLGAPADVPVYYPLSAAGSVSVVIQTVRRWSDTTAQYETAEYVNRPGGHIRVNDCGIFEIVCTVDPGVDYPQAAIESVARLFAWREHHRPQGRFAAADSDGTGPLRLQGALIKSGAAEACRYIRGPH